MKHNHPLFVTCQITSCRLQIRIIDKIPVAINCLASIFQSTIPANITRHHPSPIKNTVTSSCAEYYFMWVSIYQRSTLTYARAVDQNINVSISSRVITQTMENSPCPNLLITHTLNISHPFKACSTTNHLTSYRT